MCKKSWNFFSLELFVHLIILSSILFIWVKTNFICNFIFRYKLNLGWLDWKKNITSIMLFSIIDLKSPIFFYCTDILRKILLKNLRFQDYFDYSQFLRSPHLFRNHFVHQIYHFLIHSQFTQILIVFYGFFGQMNWHYGFSGSSQYNQMITFYMLI